MAAAPEMTGRYTHVPYAHLHFTEHKPGTPPQKLEAKKSPKQTQSQIISLTVSVNDNPVLPAKSWSSYHIKGLLIPCGIFLQHPRCIISHLTAHTTNFGEKRRNFNVAIGERIIKREREGTATEKAGFAVLYFQETLNIYIFLAYSSNLLNSILHIFQKQRGFFIKQQYNRKSFHQREVENRLTKTKQKQTQIKKQATVAYSSKARNQGCGKGSTF